MKNKEKNCFLGWYPWLQYEIFGLFQKVSNDEFGKESWWFCGPGEGMSFMADINKVKMATREEIEERIILE